METAYTEGSGKPFDPHPAGGQPDSTSPDLNLPQASNETNSPLGPDLSPRMQDRAPLPLQSPDGSSQAAQAGEPDHDASSEEIGPVADEDLSSPLGVTNEPMLPLVAGVQVPAPPIFEHGGPQTGQGGWQLDAAFANASPAFHALMERGANAYVSCANGTTYLVLPKNGTNPVPLPIEGGLNADQLKTVTLDATGKWPSRRETDELLGYLTLLAQKHNPPRPTCRRVLTRGGVSVLNLGGDSDLCVAVSSKGVEVVPKGRSDLLFLHLGARSLLPTPRPGAGNLVQYFAAAGLTDPAQWPPVLAWLLSIFLPEGEPPILVLSGPTGSGKSTCARALQRLVDPNTMGPVLLPGTRRDFAVLIENNQVLVLDNASRVTRAQSDVLAAFTSGTRLGQRKSFTDATQTTIGGRCNIILTAIQMEGLQADTTARTLTVEFAGRAPEDATTTEARAKRLADLAPGALHELLEMVAEGHRNFGMQVPKPVSRLVDVEAWYSRCEGRSPLPNGALRVFLLAQRDDAAHDAVESDPTLEVLLAYLRQSPEYECNMKSLLDALVRSHGGGDGLPKSPRALAAVLKMNHAHLGRLGIHYQQRKGRSGKFGRAYIFTYLPPNGDSAG